MRARLVVAFGLACAAALSEARAEDEVRLEASARLADPVVPYAATRFGRAAHRVRLALVNTTRARATIAGPRVEARARRGSVVVLCEETTELAQRGPLTIDAGDDGVVERTLACETPMPGSYELEVVLRSGSASVVAVATTTLVIGGGPTAPARLPWTKSAWGASSGTREVRPGRSSRDARVVVAIINGGSEKMPLAPVVARIATSPRSSAARACPEQVVPIEAWGELEAGRVHWAWVPLACDLVSEGVYDVRVAIEPSSGKTAAIAIGEHTLRVRSGPLLPLPPVSPTSGQ